MNFTVIFLLLLSAAQVSFCSNIDVKIASIMNNLQTGRPVSSEKRFYLLCEALEFGTEEQVDVILEVMFTDEYIASYASGPICALFPIDFTEESRFPLLRKACRYLAERGVEVRLDWHKFSLFDMNLDRHGAFLDELSHVAAIDFDHMLHCAIDLGRFDLVHFFISRGAGINSPRELSPRFVMRKVS